MFYLYMLRANGSILSDMKGRHYDDASLISAKLCIMYKVSEPL